MSLPERLKNPLLTGFETAGALATVRALEETAHGAALGVVRFVFPYRGYYFKGLAATKAKMLINLWHNLTNKNNGLVVNIII